MNARIGRIPFAAAALAAVLPLAALAQNGAPPLSGGPGSTALSGGPGSTALSGGVPAPALSGGQGTAVLSGGSPAFVTMPGQLAPVGPGLTPFSGSQSGLRPSRPGITPASPPKRRVESPIE